MKKMKNRYYITFNFPGFLPESKTLLTGIRKECEEYVITGFYEYPNNAFPSQSFVFKGLLNGYGKWYDFAFNSPLEPNVTTTSLYGPDILDSKYCHDKKIYRFVGNYTTVEHPGALGCLYQGGLQGDGSWNTIVPTPLTSDNIVGTICHSIMGNYLVGNFITDTPQNRAFLYNLKKDRYYEITRAGTLQITAYGIWKTSKYKYTIVGGIITTSLLGVEAAYMVEWDEKKETLSHWSFYYFNNDSTRSVVTHFNGVSYSCGIYYLTGDYNTQGGQPTGFFAKVKRNKNGQFAEIAEWEELYAPGITSISGNSVSDLVVIGVYKNDQSDLVNGYTSFKNVCNE